MTTIDYNGTGAWSREAILARYGEYARRFKVKHPLDLSPQQTAGRIYPVMDEVIKGIEAGDQACAEIGIEFIEQDASFSFGKVLKSNTARALRRGVELSPEQQARIRQRILSMLAAEYLPPEFRQYARLARKVGVRELLLERSATFNLTNPWVRHYFEYLSQPAAAAN